MKRLRLFAVISLITRWTTHRFAEELGMTRSVQIGYGTILRGARTRGIFPHDRRRRVGGIQISDSGESGHFEPAITAVE